MSQIQLTNEERIRALRQHGYTEREAQFLCLAALHSGYFLRRQYAQFLGKEARGSMTTLIEKLFANSHAVAAACDRNTHLYHLCTRPFYAALGQEDNRNRRQRECLSIKNKLMGLDFVLAHPNNTFLATEQEKTQHFAHALGIAEAKLPARTYRSAPGAPTTRYFVEKYPIFLPTNAAGTTVTSFCFIDEGLVTSSHFETFLEQYGRLFSALPAFHLVYVADRSAPFRWAENVFQEYAAKWVNGKGPNDPRIKRLTHYFALRRQYEAKDFAGFDRVKLIQLRNDQAEFSKPEHDELYELWKAGGDIAVRQFLDPESAVPAPQVSFSTHLLEHNYAFFGSLTSV
jgi:hypothetical protein